MHKNKLQLKNMNPASCLSPSNTQLYIPALQFDM